MIWVWLKEIWTLWRFAKIKLLCPHMDTNEYGGNRICLINKSVYGYEWCEMHKCPKVNKL